MLHKNVDYQCYIQYSGLPIKYSFNCFLKAGRVLVSRIVAGRLFQVRGPAISKARSPILVLVTRTKTSDEIDDRSRDLLQSSDSGLILSTKIRWFAVVQTFMHQDGKFEPDALAYSKPLKLISHQGCDVVELFDSHYQTSGSGDDRLEPNDAALWQAGKGDIAVPA